MVDLVAEGPGQQVLALDLDRPALEVEAADDHTVGPGHLLFDVGDRKAALLADRFPFLGHDLRIDQDVEGVRVLADREVDDDDPLVEPDLGRGQADAGRGVDRFDHVAGQADDVLGDGVHGFRPPGQDRVADDKDFAHGHGLHFTRKPGWPRQKKGTRTRRSVPPERAQMTAEGGGGSSAAPAFLSGTLIK